MRASKRAYFTALAIASAFGLSTPSWASDWSAYASAGSNAYYATTFGGGGINSASDAVCNGTSPNCAATNGFIGRHSPTNPIAEASTSTRGYLDFNYGGPSITAADAFAHADLTRGELKLYQAASGGGGEHTSAGAQASFQDGLHFDLSSYSAPVPITVDLRVDGSFEGFSQPRFSFYITDSLDVLATGIVGWSDNNPSGPSTTATAAFIDFGGGTGRHGDWSIYGPNRFRGTFLLDPLHPDVFVAMSLSAGGPSGTFTAFDHTAALDFTLPNGLRYTSDSGAFLSAAPPSAVPEPATWAMMMGGFGLLGLIVRRSRSTAVMA